MKILFFKKGQSLFEAVVAIAIFALASSALIATVAGGGDGIVSANLQTQAAALADEGIEAVRSIHDGAWNEFQYTQSQVKQTPTGPGLPDQWTFNGISSPEAIGQFTRTIEIDPVCRDGSNTIVVCPG